MPTLINNRYEFAIFFDVKNGNPNGDPDNGNLPRQDVDTKLGIVTDACIKRKIRNYVELTHEGELGKNILIKNTKESLNNMFSRAFTEIDEDEEDPKLAARNYMCQNYFDVRTFGAVMSTGSDPIGIVKGPVQITVAESIDPIEINDLTLTRQAVTKQDEYEKNKRTEFGHKGIVPYGLYYAKGYISANEGQKTFLTEEDIALLWEAIQNMFEHERSAARGEMNVRKLIIFKHDSKLGNIPAHKLFNTIHVEKHNDYPKSYEDYEIVIDESSIPDNVELIVKD